MAKKYEETTGSNDVYTLIGETIRYHKHQRAYGWTVAFVIIGIVLIIIGAVLIAESMLTAGIVLIVIGALMFILSLVIYNVTEKKRKKMDLAAIGKKKYDEEVEEVEQIVEKHKNKKKYFSLNDLKHESVQRLIYISRHATKIELAMVPLKGARAYNITFDDGSVDPITVSYSVYYEEFILDFYLTYRIRQANQVESK